VARPDRPRVGFVLERSLGHITHADNLRRLVPAEAGIDVELVEIPWETEGIAARLPVFATNWTVRSGLRARRAIRRMHRKAPLDALFVHTQVPAVLSADWVGRIPTVVSLDATPLQYDELGGQYGHQVSDGRIEKLKWRANRACLRRAAHIVTWSSWARDGVIDGYEIEPGKITVVPPGVVPSEWHRTEPRAAGGPVRILFVGGDLARKGGDVLLDVFTELRAALVATGGPDVELHLVTKSEVPDTPGVSVHRDMQPNSTELIALYHEADIFCLPTRGDCLPMVLSEAGAAGLPLVSTDVAGIPEIVRPGETGVLVPVDDRGALVDALRTLVEQPELRAQLGAGARRLVDREFDAVTNTHTLVELLRAASSGGGSR
jgi:glycosyltransferase involved in cell wall biosynthesis